MGSFSSTIRAVLEMDTAPFKAGAATAIDVMKKTKRSLGDIGAGSLGQYLGVGALSAGFNAALNEAQRLRDEARELGTDLDPAVARTAELADNLHSASRDLAEGGAVLVGGLQRGIDYAVAFLASAVDPSKSVSENIKSIDAQRAAAEKAARERLEQQKQERTATTTKNKEAEEAAKAGEDLRKAERSIILAQLDDLGKIAYMQDEINQLVLEEVSLGNSQAERTTAYIRRLELAEEIRLIESKITEESKRQTDEDKKQAAAEKKSADEAERKAKADRDAAEQSVRRANANVAAAKSDLATANRDRVAFSFDDAADGKRGTPEDRRRARRVRELEERARRAYDRGDRTTDTRDQHGRRIVETGYEMSKRLLGEADAVRRGFGNRLNSADRDPLAAQKKSLVAALNEAATLTGILKALQPETAPKGNTRS